MPREIFGRDFAFLPRQDLLTFEELTRLGRVFAGLGVRKLRLTGGEPLLRRDLERLVAMLAGIDGVEDIAVRTDGRCSPARPGCSRTRACAASRSAWTPWMMLCSWR
jgi:molybdenum cofactor biosynthesis enzyme MoaA